MVVDACGEGDGGGEVKREVGFWTVGGCVRGVGSWMGFVGDRGGEKEGRDVGSKVGIVGGEVRGRREDRVGLVGGEVRGGAEDRVGLVGGGGLCVLGWSVSWEYACVASVGNVVVDWRGVQVVEFEGVVV